MIRIRVKAAARDYEVLVGGDLLRAPGQWLSGAGPDGDVRIITDTTVGELYGPALQGSLRAEGRGAEAFEIAPGEPSKTLEVAARIYDWLVETGTERRDLIVALGGGVVGDLAGFVAATFLRGLRFVQVPTSLLAQVDSSVGGKVAVNHSRGKNLIGAFYPPSLVVADTAVLATLPPREYSAALAEMVKHGVILDGTYFRTLEGAGADLLRPDPRLLQPLVARSVELKAKVVEQDEQEAGLRAILNYGHTVGHAVEAATDFRRYRHGEAVAIGMSAAGYLAFSLRMVDRETVDRQSRLLTRLGLPMKSPGLSPALLRDAIRRDKKSRGGRPAWVLPEAIGRVVVRRDVPDRHVDEMLEAVTSP